MRQIAYRDWKQFFRFGPGNSAVAGYCHLALLHSLPGDKINTNSAWSWNTLLPERHEFIINFLRYQFIFSIFFSIAPKV